MVALLTSEALQVVDVGSGSHDHLKGGDDFVAGGAVACGAKQPAKREQKHEHDEKREGTKFFDSCCLPSPGGIRRKFPVNFE